MLAFCAVASPARADQIDMQNGDRYNGKILTLNSNSLVLQSEVLGTVTLPRSKVAQINFFSGTTASLPPAALPPIEPLRGAPAARTNTPSDLSASLRGLGAQTNLIRQVRSQFLSDAGPQANDKFDQLLNGLISGRLTLNDLRAEAQTAANQLRALQKDLGPDAGDSMSGYLEILDHFLRETAPVGETNTNAATAKPKSNARAAGDDE